MKGSDHATCSDFRCLSSFPIYSWPQKSGFTTSAWSGRRSVISLYIGDAAGRPLAGRRCRGLAMGNEEKCKGSRAERSRAEPSGAEPSRAEPSRAEPSRAEPSRAEPSRDEPRRAEPRNQRKLSLEFEKSTGVSVESQKSIRTFSRLLNISGYFLGFLALAGCRLGAQNSIQARRPSPWQIAFFLSEGFPTRKIPFLRSI